MPSPFLSLRRFSRATSICLAALVPACASTTALEDTYDSQSPNTVKLRVTSVGISNASNESLVLRATIRNGTTSEFRRLGCTRPALAIDSATASGWTELGAEQMESLALCVSPYYIVSAGTTQEFETVFTRKSPALRFPRNVALRLRVIGETADMGPVAPVVLP